MHAECIFNNLKRSKKTTKRIESEYDIEGFEVCAQAVSPYRALRALTKETSWLVQHLSSRFSTKVYCRTSKKTTNKSFAISLQVSSGAGCSSSPILAAVCSLCASDACVCPSLQKDTKRRNQRRTNRNRNSSSSPKRSSLGAHASQRRSRKFLLRATMCPQRSRRSVR